jgi:hypothetical protein
MNDVSTDLNFAPNTIIAEKWEVLNVIGKGAFGVIVAVKNLHTNEFEAMKLEEDDPSTKGGLMQEIRSLQCLAGVRLFEIVLFPSCSFFVLFLAVFSFLFVFILSYLGSYPMSVFFEAISLLCADAQIVRASAASSPGANTCSGSTSCWLSAAKTSWNWPQWPVVESFLSRLCSILVCVRWPVSRLYTQRVSFTGTLSRYVCFLVVVVVVVCLFVCLFCFVYLLCRISECNCAPFLTCSRTLWWV